MKTLKKALFLTLPFFLFSCITSKDVRYMQPNESLVINEEGLVPYNVPIYRITKNDILTLNIVTTPQGDAAQFYSTLNATQSTGNSGGSATVTNQGGGQGGNTTIYFNGLKVDSNGDVNVFGIGYIKAEGKTVEDMTKEIQQKVNQNFVEGKS